MSKLKQSEVSKICANIFSKFDDQSDRKEIVKNFVLAGIPTSTAYRQYAKLMLGEVQRKPGSGLSRNKLTKSPEKKIVRMIENKVFCGYRAYFDLEGFNFYGANRFAFQNLENVPDQVRFRRCSKFSSKLMVWIAIGPRGYCEPYFHLTKGALNADLYIKECLQARLIPWIKKVHQTDKVLFWPDLASCHYAKKSLETLEGAAIPYVQKADNPPNCPQLRPIEDFWANLKCKVFADGWLPKSKKELINRIKNKLKTFDESYFANLTNSIKSRVIKADRLGLNELIH